MNTFSVGISMPMSPRATIRPSLHAMIGEVLDALLVLDLGDHPDVLPLLTEHVADLLDSVGVPDEGGEDHVNALLDSKQQVRLVLLRDGREVGVGARQVA